MSAGSDTYATLIRMANQIAEALVREDDPAAATAQHVRLYWEPRMIKAVRDRNGEGLSPVAAEAFRQLESA
ncbi:MAG: formate dehydrogenase subunit delta [Sphingobium sp.]